MENVVKQKSFMFAKRIVKLSNYLNEEKKEYVLSRQILRSGTSIGANVTEALCGISRKDFIAKMYIAYKESAETLYWLELLYSCNYISEKAYISMNSDCNELIKLLSSITKTSRNNS